jgi:Cu+-exporting ATPase
VRTKEKTNLNHGQGIRKWALVFFLALVVGVPVFIIDFVPYRHKEGSGNTSRSSDEWPRIGRHGPNSKNFILFVLATFVQVVCGYPFYKAALKGLRHCSLGMDLLVVMATSIAYLYSVVVVILESVVSGLEYKNFFDSISLLLMFISFGRLLEHIAKGKTTGALSKLLSLQPTTAVLVQMDSKGRLTSEERISVDLLQVGDLLKVVPGEKIPVDGVILVGSSLVDEALITGESMPVSKNAEDHVIGGTLNQNGALIIEATHVSGDTMLSQIVSLIEEAQTSKAPIQRVADQIAGVFVPTILILSFLTFSGWFIFSEVCLNSHNPCNDQQKNVTFWNITVNATSTAGDCSRTCIRIDSVFQYAISVLVIACPCALGLATPTAVMVGTGIGAKRGVLIKGGEPLENSHRIKVMVFDKTGTLTYGRPEVIRVILVVGEAVCPSRLFTAALGLAESRSEHPLGVAITQFANKELGNEPVGEVTDFEAEPGLGMSCAVRGIEGYAEKTKNGIPTTIERFDFSNDESTIPSISGEMCKVMADHDLSWHL